MGAVKWLIEPAADGKTVARGEYPAQPCDKAHLGAEARASYIAAYYFRVEAK